MQTRDVMSSPVVTVPPDTRLKDVAAMLVEHGFSAVPVVDGHGKLLGIVTEADIIALEVTPERDTRLSRLPASAGPVPRTAGEAMTRAVHTLPEDADAAVAARLMLRHGCKSIPIVADGQVVGMVTRRDLVRVIARTDQEIRGDLERRLQEQIAILSGLALEVEGGVAVFTGAADDLARRLPESLARAVPGVVGVRWAPAEDAGPQPGLGKAEPAAPGRRRNGSSPRSR